jgi:hypothetical protein
MSGIVSFVPFQPSSSQPFQFQVVTDIATYTAFITWSLAGQRYYFNLFDLSQNLIACMAMVGSPPDYDIDLAYGQIAPAIVVFRTSTGNFEVFRS